MGDTKRNYQKRVCRKKKFYTSLILAEIEADRLTTGLLRNLEPYKCSVCVGYHLTTIKPKN